MSVQALAMTVEPNTGVSRNVADASYSQFCAVRHPRFSAIGEE